MKQFATVEEYIEVITGYLDVVTGKRTNNYYFGINPIINLARYDVSVLESMTNTTLSSNPLTERQGELAVKIILKYERQLAKKSVDVTPLREHVQWRVPLRKMDYSCRLYIENNTLILRFPYNNVYIESVREFGKNSQGACRWNKETKVWEIDLTEYNVSWLHTWTSANNFEIDPAVTELMNKICATENGTAYKIELTVKDHQITIENAESSLIDYVQTHIGELSADNILKLIDASSLLGYTVNSDIAQALTIDFDSVFCELMLQKEVKLAPDATVDNFTSVLDYADSMKRWPVVIYEPDTHNKLLNLLKEIRPEETYVHLPIKAKNSTDLLPAGVKYIHTIKPIVDITTIPLLISKAGMMFGGDKGIMIQNADKVVYYAADIYTKKK